VTSYESGKTWVIKVGSSLLTNDGSGIDRSLIDSLVDQIAALRGLGKKVVLVSSGAVAVGVKRLGLPGRPESLHELQAAAAVGQMGLIQVYEAGFQRYGILTAQVLLTNDDLRSRKRYLNARNTLTKLMDMEAIPIVNENDTVVTDEIQFSDNDSLAALVTNLINAETLVILTDQPGLLTEDPSVNPSANLIKEARASDPSLRKIAGASSVAGVGRGGMASKLNAAVIAGKSGASTIIASGRLEGVLEKIHAGDVEGTLFPSDKGAVIARKQWLASLQSLGSLVLDRGASEQLKTRGRSLLSVGVKTTTGFYNRGDPVSCLDESGKEIGKGLINYSSEEVARICGVPTSEIESVLGFLSEDELIHRDNFVLLDRG